MRTGVSRSVVRVLPRYARRGGAVHLVTRPLDLLPRRARLLRDFLAARLPPIYALGEA